MIRVCMGLQADFETTSGYFEAAVAAVPNHLMAHMMMINYLNPKWQGSLDEMYNFANQRHEESGSHLMVVLKLFAIAEEWVYYDMTEEKEKADNYFKDEEMKSVIEALYDNYEEEEDGKLLIPYVYNYFSFLFYMFGDKNKAREVIGKLGGRITVYPWAYIGVESSEELQKL